MKLKMAVVGKDVSKSLSPKMHTFILSKLGVDCVYDKISIPEDSFDLKFEEVLKEYDTLNVTIPYKLSCLSHLNEIKDDAKTFGSANTIDARIKTGYNTDGMGFMLMLENAGIEVSGKTCLVLGSGGVGRSVIKKLMEAGATVSAYDLNQEGLLNVHKEFPEFIALKEIDIKPYDIIINCTGVGMHKTEGVSPVSEDLIKLCNAAVDLIYVPQVSEFLRLAKINGKKICNGEAMLFYQAYYADCYFLGLKKDALQAKAFFEEYRNLK